mgnify:CR=1 FL=1
MDTGHIGVNSCLIPLEDLNKMMRLIEKRCRPGTISSTHHKTPDTFKLLRSEELNSLATPNFITNFGVVLIGETGRYHVATSLKRLDEFWRLVGKKDEGFDFIISDQKFEIKTGILSTSLWKDYQPLVFSSDWDPTPDGYIFTTWKPPFENRLISVLSIEQCLSGKKHIPKNAIVFSNSQVTIRATEDSELFPIDLELAYKLGLLQKEPEQLGFGI